MFIADWPALLTPKGPMLTVFANSSCEEKNMEKLRLPKMTTFGKWTVIILLAFILIWPLTVGFYWLVYEGYTAIDQTRFPDLDPEIQSLLDKTPADSPEPQKGAALCFAIRNRLEKEMNSTFGWSVNDLSISPTGWMDNRANRQRGTIFATRMLVWQGGCRK
jgi:hypothetical protein